MKTINYNMEIVTNKIETAMYKLDKELNIASTDSEKRTAYAKTIGRIEGIIQK